MSRRFASLLFAPLLVSALSAQQPPLPPSCERLLTLAFDAAAAMPIDPHIKTRMRLQGDVVDAALQLQQEDLAARLAERTDGWRQGVCLADLALVKARRGGTDEALALLQRASAVADAVLNDDNVQEWRRDRVRAHIATAYEALGRGDEAATFRNGLVANEAAALLGPRARFVTAAEFDARAAELDTILAAGDFDPVVGALHACVELHDRFYGDVERRRRMADRAQFGYARLPVTLRLDLVAGLAENALRRQDAAAAAALVGGMQQRLDGEKWLLSDRIPQVARIASLRGRAGDREQARKDLDAAVALFDGERAKMYDIYRAGTLRPVAEAWLALGDRDRATALYHRVLDEGAANPNARPRAEDLVATCISLARAGADVDAELIRRAEEIRSGLRAPW